MTDQGLAGWTQHYLIFFSGYKAPEGCRTSILVLSGKSVNEEAKYRQLTVDEFAASNRERERGIDIDPKRDEGGPSELPGFTRNFSRGKTGERTRVGEGETEVVKASEKTETE